MIDFKLKPGDTILVDFDGVIVEANRKDGTPFYPEIGPIKTDFVEFLKKLHNLGIKIDIWSARTNQTNEPEKNPIYGEKGLKQLHNFLQENKIFYDSIYLATKPISTHYAKLLIDDHTWNPNHNPLKDQKCL